MNTEIVLPPRFIAVQHIRDCLMQCAVHHPDRGIRAAAEEAREDLFDVDLPAVEAIVERLADRPYGRHLDEALADLKEIAVV